MDGWGFDNARLVSVRPEDPNEMVQAIGLHAAQRRRVALMWTGRNHRRGGALARR